MQNFNVVIFLAASAICCTAALTDLQQRRIPNLLVLAVIAIALMRMVVDPNKHDAFDDIQWAGLVVVCAILLWRLKWLGGGDVKLLFAGALLVGSSALIDYLLLTILLGGVLGILAFGDMWLERNYGWSTGLAFPRSNMSMRQADAPIPRKATVPYGIAIAFGCVFTLLAHTPFPVWH